MTQKRYQYWGNKNGIPQIMWSTWFSWNGPKETIQLKGSKYNLKNEYRIVEN